MQEQRDCHVLGLFLDLLEEDTETIEKRTRILWNNQWVSGKTTIINNTSR